MFHLIHSMVFILSSLKDVVIFWLLQHPFCTHDHLRKIYIMIIDSNWFYVCQDNSLFDVAIGFDANH